jgi:putative N6-adenine-specific DNA methylase
MDYRSFFIITQPGIEDITLQELHSNNESYQLGLIDIKKTQGGIEFKASYENGHRLNYLLKSATRILLRITEFKCRDLPKLFNKLKKINWIEYTFSEELEFKVSCAKSRLIHTKKIEESAQKAVAFYFKAQPLAKKKREKAKYIKFKFHIRIQDDLLTLSFDTTGNRLDYRSDKASFQGHAPIRDNLAYACLKSYQNYFEDSTHELDLLDPMCGSATFLKEALDFNKKNNERDYSFEVLNIAIDPFRKLPAAPKKLFKSITGSELNKETVKQVNLKSPELKITENDFFNIKEFAKPTIIISNPPYGDRISNKSATKKEFLDKIIAHAKSIKNLQGFSFVYPDLDIKKEKDNSKFKFRKGIRFSNGGIKVVTYEFKRKL